jgi:predicted amidohydrolase YtcJ
MLLPGFIDAHMHYFVGVYQSSEYMNRELFDAKSESECVEMMRKFGAAHPEYDKITGMGWFPLLWNEKDVMPSKHSLDAIEPSRPVYLLSADGHAFWLNSAALKQCGITKDKTVSYGSIGMGDDGEPNGLLFEIEACENANAIAFRLLPDRFKEMCKDFNQKLLACGITSTTDMSVNPEPVGEFSEYAWARDMEANGDLKIRLNLYPSLGIKPDTSTANRLRTEYNSDRLRVAGLKQFVDGVTSTHSAFLLSPYADRPGFCGEPCYSYDTLRDCIANANSHSFPVRLHTIGDGAIRMALDAIEYSWKVNGSRAAGNCMEHLEAIAPDDIPRFAELGVIASMQPLHMPVTAYEKEVRMGRDRCKYQWPFQSLLNSGAKLAFGADYPVAPFNPLESIHDAVARLDCEGNPLNINPWEAISLADALRAYSIGSAYSVGMERKLGTLEVGKYADIIAFDKNPFDMDPREIKDLSVTMSMVAGEVVYKS